MNFQALYRGEKKTKKPDNKEKQKIVCKILCKKRIKLIKLEIYTAFYSIFSKNSGLLRRVSIDFFEKFEK